MKLKFITLWGILSISSIGFIMSSETEVKMPNAETLQARLSKIGLDHFAEKTGIVEKLANQQKAPLDIAMTIELGFYDYNEDFQKRGTSPLTLKAMMIVLEKRKPRLFEALLENEQEALDKLKNLGFYKPAE